MSKIVFSFHRETNVRVTANGTATPLRNGHYNLLKRYEIPM